MSERIMCTTAEVHEIVTKTVNKSEKQIKEFIDLKTTPIMEQAKKTNGRVNTNEKLIYIAMGAIFILSPIFSWFLLDYLEFKQSLSDKIERSVSSALSNYEFELAE